MKNLPFNATTQEVHRALGFRKLCLSCGGPPVVRAKAFMPEADFCAKAPEVAALIRMTSPNGQIPTTMMWENAAHTRAKPYVKYADICACQHHRKELEVLLAKLP